jgi:AcrR family transcriptional regulator
MEPKDKILLGANGLFMKYGFKSITMDDIARELGVSKKTLYQFFEDKNDLVNQTIDFHIESDMQICCSIENEGHDPIEFMLEMSKSITEKHRKVNVSVLFDLRKYFKAAWDKFDNFKSNFIYTQMLNNINKGKELGLYRQDIVSELIAKLYVHSIDFMMKPELYQEISTDFQYIHQEILRHHLRGICTEKGLKRIDKLIENQHNNIK